MITANTSNNSCYVLVLNIDYVISVNYVPELGGFKLVGLIIIVGF